MSKPRQLSLVVPAADEDRWTYMPGNSVRYIEKTDGAASTPVVILASFAGGKFKHMDKYQMALYEHDDVIQVLTTMEMTRTANLQEDISRQTIQAFQDITSKPGGQDRRIIFHCFSEAGLMATLNICALAFDKPGQIFAPSRIAGIVSDSAPGSLGTKAAWQATWNHRRFRKYILACAPCFLAYFATMMMKFRPHRDAYLAKTREIPVPNKWAIIYCEDDRVSDVDGVRRFMAARRAMPGVQLRELCFERSRHVHHLILHREKYIAWCQQMKHWMMQDPDAVLPLTASPK